jgi:ATP-binding cassette subfamily B protein
VTRPAATGGVRRRTGAALRPQLPLVLAATAAVIASTMITIAGPLVVRYAIDHGLGDLAHPDRARAALNRAALVFLALALLKPLVARAQVLWSARAGERFLATLRTDAFDHLQRLSLGFFEGERAGVLVSRLTADVQSLTLFVRTALIEVVGSLLLLVVSVSVLIVLSPKLAAFTLVAVPIVAAAAAYFQRRSRPAYLAIRDRVADTMTALQERLTGIRVIQSFAREEEQLAGYRTRSRAQVRAWQNASYVNVRFFPAIALAQGVAIATVLVAGEAMYRRGEVTQGVIAAFVLYLASLFEPVSRLGDWFTELQSGRAALSKIVGLIETPVDVHEQPDAVDLPERGPLVADHVSFSYTAGHPVVRDVSLTVQPGEHLALVGATGAGKSTLAKLLVRAYDVDEGSVSFGGVDLRGASLASLRRRIVFVPQEGHLFSGSIADNVRLARPGASDAEVESALERIGALERFLALPEGLTTDVRTRGVRLSSGERQLVSLARVALVEPAAVVLDEATSSLDPATEAAVEQALAAVSAGRTVITIAHRLSTAERADRVAVLDHGRLVEIATHDELVANGERYAALWATWQAGLSRGGRLPASP